MRHFLKCAVLLAAALAIPTGVFAQTVKLDSITTFSSPDGLIGTPNEATPGPGGKLFAISAFSNSTKLSIFRIDPVAHTSTVVATIDVGQNFPAGSRLVLAPNGKFYATFNGEPGGGLLRFDPASNATAVVRQFLIDPNTGFPGPDGQFPGPLTLGRDGALYGPMSTSSTDPFSSGSLFKFDPVTGTFLTVHSFQWDIDGAFPSAPLVEGADGVFYGSNTDFATFCGSAFKLDTHTMLLSTLHVFNLATEGCGPGGFGVLPDGRIAGMTTSGTFDGVDPASTSGSVFAMDPATGSVTPLHTFLLGDGVSPLFPGNVTVSPGGNVFVLGQNFAIGTVSLFRVNPVTNATQDIQDFMSSDIGALTIGSDARLYGVGDSLTLMALGILDPLPVAPATGLSGGTVALSATVKALGIPLAGRVVTFTINGAFAGFGLTDANGVATVPNASLVGVAAGAYPEGVGASVAADSKFPAASGTGVLSVLAAATPGLMVGDGFITASTLRYDFKFVVQEKANGMDKGKLELRITDIDDGRKKKVRRDDVFRSTSYTDVVFTLDSALRPAFDTVSFAGLGTLNGQAGYRFVASALDYLGGGRHNETLTITIYDAANNVVATVNGAIKGGSLQSKRIHRD